MVESVASVDKPISPGAEQMQSSICSINNNSDKEARKSSRLKEAIMSKLAAVSNPSMPLSADLVQLRLAQFFPNFNTPSHLPYSSKAILELKEEGGSSEEAISRFIEKEYESLPWAHASFLSHHLKKLSRNQEILCVNNDRYMLPGNGGDVADGEEIHHGLKIEDRVGKEDLTLVLANGREAEVADGWSGVKGDQTEESADRFKSKRQTVKVKRNVKAFLHRIMACEEELEGKQESVGEIREQSQNLSCQIEVAEDINEENAKLAEVLKDIPRPVMGEEKKVTEEQQQQIKGASEVIESVVVMSGEQEKPQQGKMISEECSRQDQQIDIRTKVQVFSCDGQDGKNLKWKRRKSRKRRKGIRKPQLTPLWDCSIMKPLKESKKEALQHEWEEQRKPHYREKELIIVCALPSQQQPQSRTCIYGQAHKLQRDLISASLESMESSQILGQKPKFSSPQRPAEPQVTTYDSFTPSKQKPPKTDTQKSRPKVKTSFGMAKNLEELEEKRGQEFQKAKNLLKFKIKTKAIFDGEEAAVSQPIDSKDSMNVPLGLQQHGREHQNKQIKVYVRRKSKRLHVILLRSIRTSDLNILPSFPLYWFGGVDDSKKPKSDDSKKPKSPANEELQEIENGVYKNNCLRFP
ncbi:Histone H1/H5 [Corchorus olitorius]|uniref:Histone H1/H5 n=1 Tax=Corchorus olitorius TaxID=93759 RepID=A0A1R3IZS7_9ROSI|nr:Histone H1/H5 [Corchorus olitorius]